MKYLAFIAITFFTEQLLACSCSESPSLEEAYSKHKYVFIAEVSTPTIISDGNYSIKKFKIMSLENLKNAPSNHYFYHEFELQTSCGVRLNAGDKWLIFTDREKDKLDIAGCSSSLPIGYLNRESPDWKKRMINMKNKHSNEVLKKDTDKDKAS